MARLDVTWRCGCEATHLELFTGSAQSVIEKWIVDTDKMTMTFCDKGGREMLVERIS